MDVTDPHVTAETRSDVDLKAGEGPATTTVDRTVLG
jgi:hypothetical protein